MESVACFIIARLLRYTIVLVGRGINEKFGTVEGQFFNGFANIVEGTVIRCFFGALAEKTWTPTFDEFLNG
jgi:hypothetical protein